MGLIHEAAPGKVCRAEMVVVRGRGGLGLMEAERARLGGIPGKTEQARTGKGEAIGAVRDLHRC